MQVDWVTVRVAGLQAAVELTCAPISLWYHAVVTEQVDSAAAAVGALTLLTSI